jgi:hypothetical protein
MKVEHNSAQWRIAKNRHPNTDGTDWGWIDGTAPNVFWSNERGSNMTREQAGKLVEEHTAWLEKQTPIDVRLLKARERVAHLTKVMAQAVARPNEPPVGRVEN